MVRSWGIFSFFLHRRRTLRNLIYFLLSSAWFFILATGLQQICFYLIILTTIIFHGRTFDKSSPTVTHHNSIPSTLSHFFCLSCKKSKRDYKSLCDETKSWFTWQCHAWSNYTEYVQQLQIQRVSHLHGSLGNNDSFSLVFAVIVLSYDVIFFGFGNYMMRIFNQKCLKKCK